MRLLIDRARCDGHGLCRELLPDRIDVDEWGFPIIRDVSVPDALVTDTRRSVAACPALALRLEKSTP